MLNFCTYFDIFYLHRGLALYRSLAEHSESFTLWILCFDDKTYEILDALKLPHAKLIHWQDFEAKDESLLSAKKNRSKVEYYWTCTPSLPLYILKHQPDIQMITYLDADIYFFSSPLAILKELKDGSVLIIPHDYSSEYVSEEHSGKYNVGVMSFRADKIGLDCLNWWRERCIEWCYLRHEEGKFGDQGYLEDWPERFNGVVVSDNAGLHAAPWNVSKYQVKLDRQGNIIVADRPLVCYHFHSLRFCFSQLVFFPYWKVSLSTVTLASIYRPYVNALLDIERDLKSYGFDVPIPKTGIPWRFVALRIFRWQPVRHFMWAK